jgi:hypothetical protein
MSEQIDPDVIRWLEELATTPEDPVDWQMALFEDPSLPETEICPGCGQDVPPLIIHEDFTSCSRCNPGPRYGA